MAGFLSPATREQIRAASDIVDIIGAYVPLKKNGANFTALCPFHKEKSPSFNVNPHKQIFHCFGCHKGGDVFTFVKDYENIGFMDAVRRLAERAKIPLEFENTPGAQESRHLKDQLLDIHEQLTTRWQNCLANEAAGQLARDYLAKRGVSADAIKLFRIGAAPELWDDTVNWAKSKNFPLETVEQAGLIIKKEETGRHYDRFRGRLMFPICDEQGRVVGFSGRVLSGDEKTAKYVNSPETPIFTKSKIFFGLDKSKRAILDAGFAIICEGQLDLIACFTNGVQNIVAPQGTAFTESHARIIKRYANEVVLCFDSDNAGQNAIVRSLDHLLASGLAVRVAVMPSPHDPDSFIKANGDEAFNDLIQNAAGFFDYYLNRLCATNEINSDKGRLVILKSMAESVHKTGNSVLIDTYAQKTALRLGVPPESVRAEFKKNSAPHNAPRASEEEESFESVEPETEIAPPSLIELHLLKLLLLHDELVATAALNLDVNWILHPHIRQIVDLRFAAHEHETWHNLAEFLDACESPEQRNFITEAVTEDRKIPNPETQLADVTRTLKNQFLEREIQILTHSMSQPNIGKEELEQITRKQQELKFELKAIALTSIRSRNSK
ncbi:MAG TPA: DNA primase [Verrucomicrobiae bacterium]